MSEITANIPGVTELTYEPVSVLTDGGPWAQHNFPCPVCKKAFAVMELDGWIFNPCRNCESNWKLIDLRKLPFWKRWLLK